MTDPSLAATESHSGKGVQIVNVAKATAQAAAGTKYISGGKTLAGFDCSGFVYYVLHSVFPEYGYLTADEISTSSVFTGITTPEAGDIVYFPAGPNPYEVHKGNTRAFPAHVGIIIDKDWWIGRQTSKLGIESRVNVWWSGRSGVKYFRYSGMMKTGLIFLQGRSARSFA